MSTLVKFATLLALMFSSPLYAYIGPGLGAGTVGVILGVLGSIILALFAIFWYPVKRLFGIGKKSTKKEEQDADNDQGDAETAPADDGKK